jgi:nitrate reductase (NAD(P)H)
MDELVAMEARELPVTLVCAGNRRKEQNMIRQTIGFNWGPSGVSTNVWKGTPLRALLEKAGVSSTNMEGKHVEFIGIEDLPNKVGPGPFKDEPWGKLVKYGTSIPLAYAMNPANDVIIAYQANGEPLQPDHGYPVRLIIPGYIGGRMIKWLAQINVFSMKRTIIIIITTTAFCRHTLRLKSRSVEDGGTSRNTFSISSTSTVLLVNQIIMKH